MSSNRLFDKANIIEDLNKTSPSKVHLKDNCFN